MSQSRRFKVKIGINPISWMNDDLPTLGGETPLEVALSEGAEIGYQGFELGNKFPKDVEGLRAVLGKYHLECVSGWYSGQLAHAERTVEQEIEAVGPHLRLLAESGTVLLKFMLLISPDEQRERLQARIDDPAKAWKFMPRDLEVRKQWPAYMKAYETLLGATSTAHAPWTVVPADSKTHRNLMIATVVRDTLKALKLRYPPLPAALRGVKVQ